MATANVAEYGGMVQTHGGATPIIKEPPLANQSVTYTTSTQSAAFGTNTKIIRICCDALAFYHVGADPTASVAAGRRLPTGVVEYVGVNPGDKIAFYDGTS